MIKKIAAAVTVMFAAVILTACALQSDAKKEPAQPQKPVAAAPTAPVREAAAPAKAKPKAKAAWKKPQLSHPDAWTMIVVPDVQAYTERPRKRSRIIQI